MTIRTQPDFFKEKKIHSRIKHILLKETLNTSIGIANSMSWINSYIYIDLLAGEGRYGDQTEGSPMIALELMKNHLESKHYNFKKMSLIAIEEDKGSSEKLFQFLNEKSKKHPIEILQGDDKWENYYDDLKNQLVLNDGGFIFADPYALELNLIKLRDLIRANTQYIDLMFLVNRFSLKRIFGYKQKAASEIIEKYGIDLELIDSQKDLSEQIKMQIRNNFNFKDFTIGLAIPIEKATKLISIDYFYLILATNSVGVSNKFLNAYDGIIKSKQTSNGLAPGFQLKNEIANFIKLKKEQNFYNLTTYLYNNFLSWKIGTTIPGYKIPTTRNVVEQINKLIDEKKITLNCQSEYKKSNRHLRMSIKNKKEMKEIYLKFK